jgi:hypothetical protein
LTTLHHYGWFSAVKLFRSDQVISGHPPAMVSQFFRRRCGIGSNRALYAGMIVGAIALPLALGAAEARAHQTAPASPFIRTVSNSGHPIQDLGDLPPPPDADGPTPESASSVSSAEPVPELPTWAMMVLCLAGLGLAKFKRGRKDRLSPGIE